MVNTYFLVAGYLAAMAVFESAFKVDKRKKQLFWLMGICPLMFFVGLRGAVDDDYRSYIRYFELAPNLFDFPSQWSEYKEATSGVELGFALIASLFATLGIAPAVSILLFSVANFLVVGKIISDYGLKYFYSLFLYYCLFLAAFFTHIRFAFALALGFYAAMGILKQKGKIKYWAVILGAPFIHIVAFVFIFLVVCYRLTNRVKLQHLAALALVTSGLLLVFDFSSVISLILGLIGGRYEFYIGAGSGSIFSAGLRLLFLAVFLIGFPVVTNVHGLAPGVRDVPRSTFFIVSFTYFLATVVWAASWKLDVLYRLGLALQISMVLLVPYYIYFRRQQNKISHVFSITSFFLFNLYFLYALIGGSSVLGEYIMYFQT